jgi:hypothetical protein
MMLQTYSNFLAHVETTGLLAFSIKLEGFPRLGDLTAEEQWFTGDDDTDPWRWKDRAAAEKRLAFGHILGGHKGFISKAFYPLFYSAYRPDGTLEDQYRGGYISRTAYEVYNLFNDGADLDTSEIRRMTGVTKKEGASAVDNAIAKLQSAFYITVSGSRKRISHEGKEYGWPVNTYSLADNWAADWLKEPLVSTAEARARILAHCVALDHRIHIDDVDKLLFGKR